MKKETLHILEVIRHLPADASPAACWNAFAASDWPALYPLLDLAADMPRLATNKTLSAFPAGHWPQLDAVRSELGKLQELVDHPTVPDIACPARQHGLADLDAATLELRDDHCVHVDFLLEAGDRSALDAEIEQLSVTKMNSWGELTVEDGPGVHQIFRRALGSERFSRLTGFDLKRDQYTLTLALQDLQSEGIGWHRDLYWPKEWVGEDVFAVLYALGSDEPQLGGGFLHYVPWSNQVLVHYRQRHQATVMWNSADSAGRLIHAVSQYLTPQTSRHLIILQCHRRQG